MKIFNKICCTLICIAALAIIIVCGGWKGSQIEESEARYIADYANYKTLQAEIAALDFDSFSRLDIDGIRERVERLPASMRYEFDLQPYYAIIEAETERAAMFIELLDFALGAEENFAELISQIEEAFLELRQVEREAVQGRYVEAIQGIQIKIENAQIFEIIQNVQIWQSVQLSSRDYAEVKQLIDRIDALTFADRLTEERKALLDILSAIKEIICTNEHIALEVNSLYGGKVQRADRERLKEIESKIWALNDYDRELNIGNLEKISEINDRIDRLIIDIAHIEDFHYELVLVGVENLHAENLPKLYELVAMIDSFHENERAALLNTREYFIYVIDNLEGILAVDALIL